MAKRKKRNDEGSKFEYSAELYGLAYMILAVLGFGVGKPLGFIGKLVRSFSVFCFGTLDGIFLLALFLLGVYLLIKKRPPAFLSTKFIGVFILLVGVLVFSHLKYVENFDGNASKIFKETLNNSLQQIDLIRSGLQFSSSGSGLIGCGFAVAFNVLFDYTGTKIVAIVLIVAGACFFTGFSIRSFFRKGIETSKKLLPKGAKKDEKQPPLVVINDNTGGKEDNEKEESGKTVISSIDELKNVDTHREEIIPVEKVATNENYILPSLSMLNNPPKSKNTNSQTSIEANIEILENVLKDFGIISKVVEVNSGPSVTQYELDVQTGTKLSKITGINKEISLAVAKKDVRIQAPIPGKRTVGIELANDSIASVSLKEILEKVPENKKDSRLLVALGKNIMGNSIFAEIDKTPHLLVAGSTGSGKSVCINCIIASILMRTKPDQVKMVMVDPKKVELNIYNGIPHLMMPVVTDPKKASIALQKIVAEMEDRYERFSEKNAKNITSFNEMIEKENANRPDGDKIPKMSYIVVIIDELADLMLVARKEVEDSIMRIAQMARAAGIHMIIATQRPSTDVITGVLKANIPSRISFAVSSNIDSRTILDMSGAEKLLGRGDMLFLPMGENSPQRVQGAYVSDEEISKIVEYTVGQQKAQYDERFMNLNTAAAEQGNAGGRVEDIDEEYDDALYSEIVEFVIKTGKASGSLLQRRFKVGYNRAARIIDLLEERGIIGPQNGSKPREVLVELDDDRDIE